MSTGACTDPGRGRGGGRALTLTFLRRCCVPASQRFARGARAAAVRAAAEIAAGCCAPSSPRPSGCWGPSTASRCPEPGSELDPSA
ncbi:unnamed protein product [Gulo gulo]|uniref:Uncharacterized protein n=1 Tax=Gulo gulo TaxID=48420 RepID=A0A9X9ME83_GULGU|nr:unnamed protein product [Gulo gulo]